MRDFLEAVRMSLFVLVATTVILGAMGLLLIALGLVFDAVLGGGR